MVQSQPPIIIQGGMEVGVSAWQLAKAVSITGQLGVVAGTALDTVLVRRLQSGDPGCHIRRALAEFPTPDIADRGERYFAKFLSIVASAKLPTMLKRKSGGAIGGSVQNSLFTTQSLLTE